MLELLNALDEINWEIKDHWNEWSGMVGTSYEKEDWRDKQLRRHAILREIQKACEEGKACSIRIF